MSQDVVTIDELTELLADATGQTPEAIERGSKSIEIRPPEEGTVRTD